MLSSSLWARFVQGISCFSRAACLVHHCKAYQYNSVDSHVMRIIDTGSSGPRCPGGQSFLSSPNKSCLGNLSLGILKTWPADSHLSLLLCSCDSEQTHLGKSTSYVRGCTYAIWQHVAHDCARVFNRCVTSSSPGQQPKGQSVVSQQPIFWCPKTLWCQNQLQMHW